MAEADPTSASAPIRVEVAYARPDDQRLIALYVAPGTTVLAAIHASGILVDCPGIDLDQQPVGIFSQPVSLDAELAAGDRVEIYRPLRVDPKAQRRDRARAQRTARPAQPSDS